MTDQIKEDIPPTLCAFCGKDRNDIGPLAEGTGLGDDHPVYICGDCVNLCKRAIEEEMSKRISPQRKLSSIPTPKQIVEHLDKFVIGQGLTKKKLGVEVSNHYSRLLDHEQHDRAAKGATPIIHDPDLMEVVIEKSNVLLVGPTGCGKTLLAKSLAELLRVPFAIGDATTLTEAGYVGEDVENLLQKLLVNAEFDIEAAQRGIVYIDEIDKIRSTHANTSITRDVSGTGVQQSLLKLIEGTVSNVPPQGGRKHPEQQYIPLDTTNILFICGGAFVGLDNIVRKRLNKGGMGFHAVAQGDPKDEYNSLMAEVNSDDLEEFGLIPELVGRLPVVCSLEELDEAALKLVLTEPKNALLKQEAKKLAYKGVKLEFTDDAIAEIAAQAAKKGMGARGLRSVVADFMTDICYDVGKEHRGKKLVVDREVVRKTKSVFPSRKEAA